MWCWTGWSGIRVWTLLYLCFAILIPSPPSARVGDGTVFGV
ncbi:hypothetical protein DSM107133_01088 [Pseudosulfitobacter sp. DSM 107133]|nr:hypothetical protein DSM107133_01088 [Pseudosulfitobacter sp. DSM 107133]